VEAKGGTSAAEHRQETCQAVTPKGCTPQALAGMVPFLLIQVLGFRFRVFALGRRVGKNSS